MLPGPLCVDRMRTRCSRGALTDAIVPPSHGPDIDEDEVRKGAVLVRNFGIGDVLGNVYN